MSNKNDGKEAENAFETYWKKVGTIERFYDQRDLRGRNGGKAVGDFPKPADFIVASPSVPTHLAEVKSCHGKVSFPFAAIQDSQASAAKRSYLKGDQSYRFYIFSYPLGAWFVMTCAQFVFATEAGHASIKFSELTPWRT